MGRVSLELGRRVCLDANIIIYAVEGFADYADEVRALLEAMDTGEIVAVTSELTVAETLVKPMKGQNPVIQQAYRTFLTPTAAMEIIPISRDILEDAARLRANTKLKLPNAIQLATALREQCDSFITNDDGFRSINLSQIKMLADVTLV